MRRTARANRPGPGRAPFRPGLALRRHPRLWWAVTALGAMAAGWITATAVSDAHEARAAWGDMVTVLVARHDVAAGDDVGAADVTRSERPAAVVPEGALRSLRPGAVARSTIVAGEVVVAARVAPPGTSAVAARLPAGTRAVAIPLEPGLAPPLEVGDAVDVLVALPPEAAGGGPPGFTVATEVLVVDVGELAVTVAVPRDAAPRVAVALGHGAVSLALVGG